jgi:hypothetical protein
VHGRPSGIDCGLEELARKIERCASQLEHWEMALDGRAVIALDCCAEMALDCCGGRELDCCGGRELDCGQIGRGSARARGCELGPVRDGGAVTRPCVLS